MNEPKLIRVLQLDTPIEWHLETEMRNTVVLYLKDGSCMFARLRKGEFFMNLPPGVRKHDVLKIVLTKPPRRLSGKKKNPEN